MENNCSARNPRMQFQNKYSEGRRKNERQNKEEDSQENQYCYEKRRVGRRYDEDQWERNQQPRPARLEFPRFTSKNPNTWLFKANTFFEYYQTPVWDRIPIAAFHMRGEAAIWFGDVKRWGLISNWESFISKLKYQFRKQIQEEHEEIQRLHETEYQFRKVIQEVKEMQEEEEANQKVQQQFLRRQIDEELHQAMEKLHEWFSKGNNSVVNSQGVAQEDAFEIPNSLKSNDQPLVMNFLVFGFCLCIL
jgi:hypothetical protein